MVRVYSFTDDIKNLKMKLNLREVGNNEKDSVEISRVISWYIYEHML